MHSFLVLHRFFAFLVFTSFSFLVFSQSRFRLMEYNVENLFDVFHDSLKADQEFLPGTVRNWTKPRFWKKLIHISQVISSAADDQLPDVIMLCEVENDSVLLYLTRRSPLRVAGYDYYMTHSPDERGIDIAFLYQKATFKPLKFDEIEIDRSAIGNRPTRNILHVEGITQTRDTLDLFLCHFPSRSRGQRISDPYRRHVAQVLKQHVDSVMAHKSKPRIIITGDFNDFPDNASLKTVLKASKVEDEIHPLSLYNLLIGKKPGTYKYQGKWNTLDHFIVNGNLLYKQSGHFYTAPEWVKIHQPSFILEEDLKYGGLKPFRTYNGLRYQGGYSDHLPVVADFHW